MKKADIKVEGIYMIKGKTRKDPHMVVVKKIREFLPSVSQSPYLNVVKWMTVYDVLDYHDSPKGEERTIYYSKEFLLPVSVEGRMVR